MTLKFIQPTGSYTNAVSFSMDIPNITGISALELTSKYNQEVISLDLVVATTNDRYTEFTTDYTDVLGDDDYSGFFNYTLLVDGQSVDDGLLKLINNKTKSLENKDKYVSPNQDGSAYVIYE